MLPLLSLTASCLDGWMNMQKDKRRSSGLQALLALASWNQRTRLLTNAQPAPQCHQQQYEHTIQSVLTDNIRAALSFFPPLKRSANPDHFQSRRPDSLHAHHTTLIVHFTTHDGQLTLVRTRILPRQYPHKPRRLLAAHGPILPTLRRKAI